MYEILNITNGEYFNDYFLAKFGGVAIPFCDSMMDGDTVSEIYSDKFIEVRAAALAVDRDEYKSKMLVPIALAKKNYSKICLWFGKDTFCQANLLTILAYLEEIEYSGAVVLNYIDDQTFEVIGENIPVKLGMYRDLYKKILIEKSFVCDLGVLVRLAFELYFDYRSDEGMLANLVRDNADKDDVALISILLEKSIEYGLSDRQAENLVRKYKNN